LLRRCFPITRGAQNLTFFLQLTPSSEKKSIPELKTQLAVRPVLDSLLASANGCICGGILGANAMMVSSASTLSLMHEVTLQCLDLNSPHLGVFTFVPAGSPQSLSPLSPIIVRHYPVSGGFWRPGLYPSYLFSFFLVTPLPRFYVDFFLLSSLARSPRPFFSQMCYLLC